MEKETIITNYSTEEVESILNKFIQANKQVFPTTGRLVGNVRHGVFYASQYKKVYSPRVLSYGRAEVFSVNGRFFEHNNQTQIEWFPDCRSHAQVYVVLPILLMPISLIFLLTDFSCIPILVILIAGTYFYLQYSMLKSEGENVKACFKQRMEREFHTNMGHVQ